jgi:phospholipase/carboxylesterase
MERSLAEQVRLYYDLHVPPTQNTRRRTPLLIALHGYSGNKDSMMRLARRINERDWLIATLEGPYRFVPSVNNAPNETRTGFGWASPYKHDESVALHHQSLLDLIEAVAAEYAIDRQRIFLLGFSQPVSLNYRFVFTYPNVIRGVIGVCGGIPGDREQNPYQPSTTDVLHIATTQDEYYDVDRVRSFIPWLRQQGQSVELRVYQGAHVFPRRSLRYIAQWISQRIAQDSKRS